MSAQGYGLEWILFSSLSIYGFKTFLLVATKRDNILSIINEETTGSLKFFAVTSADSYLATFKDSSL